AADVAGYMKTAATTDFFAPRVFPYLRAAVDALPPATPDLPQLDTATDFIGVWLSSAGGALLADGSEEDPTSRRDDLSCLAHPGAARHVPRRARVAQSAPPTPRSAGPRGQP